jgi:hypothetical protein
LKDSASQQKEPQSVTNNKSTTPVELPELFHFTESLTQFGRIK